MEGFMSQHFVVVVCYVIKIVCIIFMLRIYDYLMGINFSCDDVDFVYCFVYKKS